ncbi:SGNH/GDSL hydrolase family protein [Hydrogenophaga sp. 5NK40-0174]|uniref:SGNH/GDSL hydrolase family protein n=1 Tax=Hydrogenophaga sp. 5NK40-0174 TaxID=3127649 RepID=UPI003109F13D
MNVNIKYNMRVLRLRLSSSLMSEREPMKPAPSFRWSKDFASGSISGAQLVPLDDPGFHLAVPIDTAYSTQGREVFRPVNGLGAREVFSFWFDGSALEIDGQSHPNYGVMLWVEGARVAEDLIVESAPSNGNIRRQLRVDFDSRALRRVVVMPRHFGGTAGVFINPNTDSVIPYTPGLSTPMVALTDSYGGFGQWGFPHGGASILLADALGFHFANLQHGGSGYETTNQGLNFLNRLQLFREHTEHWPPSVLVVSGGINDPANARTHAQIQAFFAYCRHHLQQTLLIVHGPWCPRQSYLNGRDKYSLINQYIRNELANLGSPWWIYLNTLEGGWVTGWGASAPGNGPWITGTGTIANPKGDGNADVYIDADGTHPTHEGQRNGVAYMARRTRREVLAALQTAQID